MTTYLGPASHIYYAGQPFNLTHINPTIKYIYAEITGERGEEEGGGRREGQREKERERERERGKIQVNAPKISEE